MIKKGGRPEHHIWKFYNKLSVKYSNKYYGAQCKLCIEENKNNDECEI